MNYKDYQTITTLNLTDILSIINQILQRKGIYDNDIHATRILIFFIDWVQVTQNPYFDLYTNNPICSDDKSILLQTYDEFGVLPVDYINKESFMYHIFDKRVPYSLVENICNLLDTKIMPRIKNIVCNVTSVYRVNVILSTVAIYNYGDIRAIRFQEAYEHDMIKKELDKQYKEKQWI